MALALLGAHGFSPGKGVSRAMTPRQQSIFIGALVVGVLNTSYLSFINFVCCLGVFIGSIVAVQQYTVRETPVIESGDGAILGALAGGGGAILGSLFNLVLRPLELDSSSITQGWVENMMSNMQGQQGMSPEVMQQYQQGGSLMGFLFGLVASVIIFAIFGAIGGAIGSALFGEEETPS